MVVGVEIIQGLAELAGLKWLKLAQARCYVSFLTRFSVSK
jgi:hypothetical protein